MIRSITEYFAEKLNLDDYQQKLFAHGLDIIFCDGSEFLSSLVFSVLLNFFRETLVYLLLFALLRINTGGWHARTRVKCFVIFESLYFLFLISMKITIPLTIQDYYTEYNKMIKASGRPE